MLLLNAQYIPLGINLIYIDNRMGLFLSKIWRRLFSHDQEFKLVIIGLQNAGKTTILYKL